MMTTLLNRIETTTKLWELTLPNFPVPPSPWLARLATFSDAAIEAELLDRAQEGRDLQGIAADLGLPELLDHLGRLADTDR